MIILFYIEKDEEWVFLREDKDLCFSLCRFAEDKMCNILVGRDLNDSSLSARK